MELLTIAEVCQRYGMKRAYVYRKVHSADWAGFVCKLGTLRVRREGLDAWIEAGGDLVNERAVEPRRQSRQTAPRSPRGRGNLPTVNLRKIERLKPDRDPFSY